MGEIAHPDFERSVIPYSNRWQIIAIRLLKLNHCKKVFCFSSSHHLSDVLVMKKLEIEKTKPPFIISVLKVEY